MIDVYTVILGDMILLVPFHLFNLFVEVNDYFIPDFFKFIIN